MGKHPEGEQEWARREAVREGEPRVSVMVDGERELEDDEVERVVERSLEAASHGGAAGQDLDDEKAERVVERSLDAASHGGAVGRELEEEETERVVEEASRFCGEHVRRST